MYRITLTNGETHICQDGGSEWVAIDGDWIDKDNPAIGKVESGRLLFKPDTETVEPNPNEDIDSVTEKLSRQDFRAARGELYRLLRELKELRAKVTPEPFQVGDTVKLSSGAVGQIQSIDAKYQTYYVVFPGIGASHYKAGQLDKVEEPTPYNVGDTVKLKFSGYTGTVTEVDTSAKLYRYYVKVPGLKALSGYRLADELEFDA